MTLSRLPTWALSSGGSKEDGDEAEDQGEGPQDASQPPGDGHTDATSTRGRLSAVISTVI